jgi:hypothetical protein
VASRSEQYRRYAEKCLEVARSAADERTQAVAAFERWLDHYRAQQRVKEAAADARAMKLWDERRSVLALRRFLAAGPLRAAAERRFAGRRSCLHAMLAAP